MVRAAGMKHGITRTRGQKRNPGRVKDASLGRRSLNMIAPGKLDTP